MTDRLSLPHHDPSVRHVSDPDPAPGDTVEIRVQVPDGWRSTAVHLRTVIDGEAHYAPPRHQDRRTGDAVFELACTQPVQHYRFHLRGPHGGHWLNGLGVVEWDPDDHADFKLVPGHRTPVWVPERVWYQIFPDRFATTGRHRHKTEWARWAEWDDPVERRPPDNMCQLYGGDLDGIIDHLDHVTALGIGGIYLTPFFPARSNHRYDARTFDTVDPLLGGNDALIRLRRACDRAELKLIGDLTLNHTGDQHEWFVAAQADPASAEADFYYFTDHPDGYVSWLDVPSLPKLDHRNAELARRLYDGPESVVARWLGDPYRLDGWRIDVANMTGRQGRIDLNQEVARRTRSTMEATGRDPWLVAEHFFDAAADAPGDGWHGVMNYAGISRPIASWLGKTGTLHGMSAGPGQDPRAGAAVARSLDTVRAAMSWAVLLGSMGLLSSHDTARWRTMSRSDDLALVGFGMLLTLPGAPCLLYGDEIGLRAAHSEESRAPMPWGRRWNRRFLEWYRSLIAVRNTNPALQRGGFRWVHIDDDQLVWLRETLDQRILVRAARAAGPAVILEPDLLGAESGQPLVGDQTLEGAPLILPGDGPAFEAWELA